jgi:iron(III) transport system ATP-binding protein
MTILQLNNIGKKFTGSKEWAVKDFNLEVAQGEIVALLGESGCGKTTILRMIAGFETPGTGSITINGETVVGPGIFTEPQQRKVGIVFQDYALFPHKTVWENIRFGLFRLKQQQAREKAATIMELCGLTGLEKRYPHQLSGGQKQRVALARAMAPEPRIILFDEPFSNLDSMRKNQMRDDIRHIIRNTGATAVFVTHDTKDVLAIADKVSVMRQGTSLQSGAPEAVYNYPLNPYVADFFGKTNLIKARVTQEGFHTHLGLIKAENLPQGSNSEVTLSIRPEQFHISSTHHGCFCGDVISERFLGEYTEVTCRVETASGEFQEVVLYAAPHFSCQDRKCYFKPKDGKINIMKI